MISLNPSKSNLSASCFAMRDLTVKAQAEMLHFVTTALSAQRQCHVSAESVSSRVPARLDPSALIWLRTRVQRDEV
jgi:hypothetical protein